MAKDLTKIYCNLCSKQIDECKCKKPNPVETKVTQPAETK